MKESTRKILQNIFSTCPTGFLLVESTSLNILITNPSFETALGYERDSLSSISLFSILQQPELLSEVIGDNILKKPNLKMSMHFLNKRCLPVNLSFHITKVVDEVEPTLSYLTFNFESILFSEQTRSIDILGNLLNAEGILNTVLEILNNGLIFVDRRGIILDIAPQNKFHLFQVSHLKIGDFAFSFLDPETQNLFTETITEVQSNNSVINRKFIYFILGREFSYEVKFIPFPYISKYETLTMLVFIDRTDADETEKHLIESIKFVNIGEIAAGLAHEINNPLQSALLYLDDLIVIGEDDPLERLKILTKIESANFRIRDLVKSLLDLGRIESSQRDLVSPYYILVRASELIEVACKKKGIQLVKHAMANLPGIVVRWQEIEQVLINCVVNSINAISEMESPPSLPKIDIGIELLRTNNKDMIVFFIEDNGPGMSEEIRDKVFLPLFTTRREKQGTGLGLSISKKIINEHDGEIVIKTTLGFGTRVEIKLPVKLVDHA